MASVTFDHVRGISTPIQSDAAQTTPEMSTVVLTTPRTSETSETDIVLIPKNIRSTRSTRALGESTAQNASVTVPPGSRLSKRLPPGHTEGVRESNYKYVFNAAPCTVPGISNVASFWQPLPFGRSELELQLDRKTLELKAALISLDAIKAENAALKAKLRQAAPRCGSSIVETASVWGDPVIERDHETARFGDEVTGMLGSALVQEDVDSWDDSAFEPKYTPSLASISLILNGQLILRDCHPTKYRDVVWVIANCIPSGLMESTSLKSSVHFLTNELLHRAGEPAMDLLIIYIIELSIKLCKTPSGNYLCQVMLDTASSEDCRAFIFSIQSDLIDIANHRFGCHVLNKAMESDDLQALILEQLVELGIAETMQTGARRVWRTFIEICRKSKKSSAFKLINESMTGKWVKTAMANEHGSIACQQVFELYPAQELMEPCFKEIINAVDQVANSTFGRFVIAKLLSLPSFSSRTIKSILTSKPPVATSNHGVGFVKVCLAQGGREGLSLYVREICMHSDGEPPSLIEIAGCSSGPPHLHGLYSMLSQTEKAAIRTTCKAFSTTLRMTQSGNDFLRMLGLIAMGTTVTKRALRRL